MSNQAMGIAPPAWTLADRLKKARESAGFDQVGLAKSLGIARQSVSNYETGRTLPNRPVIELWALRCSVPYEWLNGDQPAGYTESYSLLAGVA